MGKAQTDITKIKECPDCGSSNITKNKEKQQVICKDCGLIYEPFTEIVGVEKAAKEKTVKGI